MDMPGFCFHLEPAPLMPPVAMDGFSTPIPIFTMTLWRMKIKAPHFAVPCAMRCNFRIIGLTANSTLDFPKAMIRTARMRNISSTMDSRLLLLSELHAIVR